MLLSRTAGRLIQAVRRTSNVAFYIGISMIMVLVIITVADVLARVIISTSITGIKELSQYAVGILVFLSIQYCAFKGTHIVVDALVMHFPRRLQNLINVFIYCLSWIICGVASWQLFMYGIRTANMGQVSPLLGIWKSPFVFMAFIGFLLAGLAYFILWLRSLKGIRP